MFDTVCKFLAETFPQDFARWLLGEAIDLTELSPSELSLEPIRADAVILLQSDRVILHLEFQTRPDAQIPFRMLDYRVRLYRRFPDRPVEQVVFYLTPSPSPLVHQTTFDLPHTHHEFRVVRFWEQAVAAFLESPGLLPFAVLCQGDMEDAAGILRSVAHQIDTLPDRSAQAHVAASAAILAGLVLEKSTIQQVLRRDIMRESVMYQSILQEGWEEGHQQGLERGLERGLEQGLERGLEQGLERGLEQGLERGLEQGLERGLEQGLERGLEQGLEQGMLAGKLEALPMLLELGVSVEEVAERLDLELRVVRRSALPWLLRQGRSLAEIAADWRLKEATLEPVALVEVIRAKWSDGEILERLSVSVEQVAAVRSAPIPPLLRGPSPFL